MAVPGDPDTSLGQGPLLVFTPRYVFSVQAPVNRDTWKNLTYPIQAISLLTSGALGARSAITVNGDVFYRAVDGIRSFIIARRSFTDWGNTPISGEIVNIVENDQTDLLWSGSAVVFDNRLLMTTQPVYDNDGVYHRALGVLDFDLVTSMRKKMPPAWAGIWTGLKILQIVKTENVYGDQCWIFARGQNGNIQLWEVTKSGKFDVNLSGSKEIQWLFQTRAYNFELPFGLKRLDSGDIFIDQLEGDVNFEAKYKPDQYPGWIEWTDWAECARVNLCGFPSSCLPITNYQPQYRPKMRLPTPSDNVCNSTISTPTRNLFEVQMQLLIIGYCRIKSIRVHAYDVQEPVVGDCRPTLVPCSILESCDLNQFFYSSE